eukprot:gene19901-26604_t
MEGAVPVEQAILLYETFHHLRHPLSDGAIKLLDSSIVKHYEELSMIQVVSVVELPPAPLLPGKNGKPSGVLLKQVADTTSKQLNLLNSLQLRYEDLEMYEEEEEAISDLNTMWGPGELSDLAWSYAQFWKARCFHSPPRRLLSALVKRSLFFVADDSADDMSPIPATDDTGDAVAEDVASDVAEDVAEDVGADEAKDVASDQAEHVVAAGEVQMFPQNDVAAAVFDGFFPADKAVDFLSGMAVMGYTDSDMVRGMMSHLTLAVVVGSAAGPFVYVDGMSSEEETEEETEVELHYHLDALPAAYMIELLGALADHRDLIMSLPPQSKATQPAETNSPETDDDSASTESVDSGATPSDLPLPWLAWAQLVSDRLLHQLIQGSSEGLQMEDLGEVEWKQCADAMARLGLEPIPDWVQEAQEE